MTISTAIEYPTTVHARLQKLWLIISLLGNLASNEANLLSMSFAHSGVSGSGGLDSIADSVASSKFAPHFGHTFASA